MIVTGSVNLQVTLPDRLRVFGRADYRATQGRTGSYGYPEEISEAEFTGFTVLEWEVDNGSDQWDYYDADDFAVDDARIVAINDAAFAELNGDPTLYEDAVWEDIAGGWGCDE